MIKPKYSPITTVIATDFKNNFRMFSFYLFGLPIFTIKKIVTP